MQEVSNQNEDTKADEDKKEKKAPKKGSWDEVKRKRVNGFLYSPEAYAVEKELQSPYEDSIHEIMNCPVQAGGGGLAATLGHAYDVVFLANCNSQNPQADNSKAADVPDVKRLSSSQKIVQKVSSTYGIAVLYAARSVTLFNSLTCPPFTTPLSQVQTRQIRTRRPAQRFAPCV